MSEDNKKNIVSKSDLVKKVLFKYNESQVESVSDSDISKKRISEVLVNNLVSIFLEEILNSVSEGKNVIITNFFSIKGKLSKSRKSRNFQTQEEIFIPERINPKITFSSNFKNRIREGKNFE